MRKNSPRLLVGTVLSSMATAALVTAIEGIIGNRANDLFGWLLAHLALVAWLWVVLAILLFLVGYLFITLLHSYQKIEELNRRTEHMIMLDEGLFKQLTILVGEIDIEVAMRPVLRKLLRDAREAFPEARQACLCLPDPQAPEEYLMPWLLASWGEDNIPDRKFYIGGYDPAMKRGLAGEAFHHSEILITKFNREANGGKLIPTRDSYIFFGEDHTKLPYSVLVCVPIIANTDKKKPHCLGVVCFDSENQDTFDSPGVKTMLKLLGRRLAFALEIYERLQKSSLVPQQKLSK